MPEQREQFSDMLADVASAYDAEMKAWAAIMLDTADRSPLRIAANEATLDRLRAVRRLRGRLESLDRLANRFADTKVGT